MAEAKSFDVNGTEVILKDEYARKEIKKTNENLDNIANELGKNEDDSFKTLETDDKTIIGAINEVFQNASKGKVAIVTALTGKGITATESDTFAQLAEKIGTISGSGNTFNITNNLTNATNNNTKTTIEEYNSYKANISAESGYRLDSVVITMSGINVTSDCYSNGTIHIEDVTGHLVITVVAVLDITPTATLNWNFANEDAGNGYGDIQLTVNDESLEGDYDICYADDTGQLSDYDKICTLSAIKDTTKSYNYFNKFQLIPSVATKIVAVKDNIIKTEFSIPTSKRFNKTNKLYSFGAISDIHLSVDTAESDFTTALTYLNDTEKVAFICVSGDLTNDGTEAQFTKFKQIVNTNSPNTKVIATNGNHENRNTTNLADLWTNYVDNPRNYVFTHNNDVFVFLALDSNSYGKAYTDEQKTWLENIISKYSNCRIFVFTHPFINGTGNGNYNSLYPVNMLDLVNDVCGKWLFKLLQDNTNVSLITGHSHLKFITQELDSRITICDEMDNTKNGYLIHIPSITIPRDIVDGSSISNYLYAQSEGVIIDVYSDCIIYRGRNFVDGKFIPIGQFFLPYAEGILPTITYNITNALGNCSNSNSATTIEEGSSYQANISAESGYILSNITITMSGTDITSSCVSNNNINIANVTGDIIITANATKVVKNYAVTNNLTNATNSNTNNSVEENNSYTATITPASEYTDVEIEVTMSGTDITSSCVSNNNINIANVTGDIIITAKGLKIEILVSLDELAKGTNYVHDSTVSYDSDTKTFSITKKGQAISWFNVPVNIAQGETVYAKWDSCEISGGNTIANHIGLCFAFNTVATGWDNNDTIERVNDYLDYSDETELINKATKAPIGSAKALSYLVTLYVKASGSGYTGTYPVTMKIDNFRIYKKSY